MASDPFDFSDVFTEIENGINDFMNAETTKIVLQDKMVKSADANVYSYRSPATHPYQRRGTMKQLENYEVIGGRLSLTVINTATGSGMAGDLNDIIEQGVGYEWENSEIYRLQPYPRPFMQEGIDTFVDDYLLPSIHDIFFND